VHARECGTGLQQGVWLSEEERLRVEAVLLLAWQLQVVLLMGDGPSSGVVPQGGGPPVAEEVRMDGKAPLRGPPRRGRSP